MQEALRANVALEDINRTALVRLKQVSINNLKSSHAKYYHSLKFQGLEESGERFPYQIPPKNAKKDFENRSLSPVDWTEM